MGVPRTKVDKYQQVGAGGFGQVWAEVPGEELVAGERCQGTCFKFTRTLADCPKLQHEYAVLKYLKETSLGKLFFPQVIRYVRHPNGSECIEMQRLHGHLWSGIGERGTQARALSWMGAALQAAECLMALHAEGICHNDVKPHNFMRDREGRLVLIDFGLASFVSDHQKPGPQAWAVSSETTPSGSARPSGSGSKYRPREEEESRRGFAGTSKYCSIRVHEKKQAHPADDFTSLCYLLWEKKAQQKLPWNGKKDKDRILKAKQSWVGWAELPMTFAMIYQLCQDTALFDHEELARLLYNARFEHEKEQEAGL